MLSTQDGTASWPFRNAYSLQRSDKGRFLFMQDAGKKKRKQSLALGNYDDLSSALSELAQGKHVDRKQENAAQHAPQYRSSKSRVLLECAPSPPAPACCTSSGHRALATVRSACTRRREVSHTIALVQATGARSPVRDLEGAGVQGESDRRHEHVPRQHRGAGDRQEQRSKRGAKGQAKRPHCEAVADAIWRGGRRGCSNGLVSSIMCCCAEVQEHFAIISSLAHVSVRPPKIQAADQVHCVAAECLLCTTRGRRAQTAGSTMAWSLLYCRRSCQWLARPSVPRRVLHPRPWRRNARFACHVAARTPHCEKTRSSNCLCAHSRQLGRSVELEGQRVQALFQL